jgi:hypothetical protein
MNSGSKTEDQGKSAGLPDWPECDAFCITSYSGAGAPPCGWRGRIQDAKYISNETKPLCPRCGCTTLFRIPPDRKSSPDSRSIRSSRATSDRGGALECGGKRSATPLWHGHPQRRAIPARPAATQLKAPSPLRSAGALHKGLGTFDVHTVRYEQTSMEAAAAALSIAAALPTRNTEGLLLVFR